MGGRKESRDRPRLGELAVSGDSGLKRTKKSNCLAKKGAQAVSLGGWEGGRRQNASGQTKGTLGRWALLQLSLRKNESRYLAKDRGNVRVGLLQAFKEGLSTWEPNKI